MPVRVIFRGLILFQFPNSGLDQGKLVALLVNKRSVTGDSSMRSNPNQRHGKHEHYHNADYQILDGKGTRQDVVPRPLDPGVDLDITVDESAEPSKNAVGKARSFLRHVPNLDNIVDRGSPKVREAKRGDPKLGDDFVSNIVRVNRGTVLVRDVVTWDEAGYPLSGNALERGERPRSHAVAKFMGSDVSGHMASEVVVHIEDANRAVVKRSNVHKPEEHVGTDSPNPHVPENTVEIVVTNYEYQRGTPVPWSLDFQWLFEVAGYGEADLSGREFDAWIPFATRYNEALFNSDRDLLLRNGTFGWPFPYLESYDSLTPLKPLTNELERPLCSSGTTTKTIIPAR